MKQKNTDIGNWGEEQAVQYLKTRDYSIEEQNFSCRRGEIDIIAYKQDELYGRVLCFIEVKTRSTKQNGSAERAVDIRKLTHMKRAAIEYCQQKHVDSEQQHISFEQVSVYKQKDEQSPHIQWYQILSF